MSDAVSNEDFYARLGIAPAVKAKGIRAAMAENAERAAAERKLLARLDMTAIKTTAKAL